MSNKEANDMNRAKKTAILNELLHVQNLFDVPNAKDCSIEQREKSSTQSLDEQSPNSKETPKIAHSNPSASPPNFSRTKHSDTKLLDTKYSNTNSETGSPIKKDEYQYSLLTPDNDQTAQSTTSHQIASTAQGSELRFQLKEQLQADARPIIAEIVSETITQTIEAAELELQHCQDDLIPILEQRLEARLLEHAHTIIESLVKNMD